MKSALVNSTTYLEKKMMNNNEKIGVIDVGSNSVRSILFSDGKILYKELITSRLGEGLAKTGMISEQGLNRTVDAIKTLAYRLISRGAERLMPFATEAVRSAKNGNLLVEQVKEQLGVTVEVVSGDEEGELGLLGALEGKDGGVIDIGGASAEIVVAKDKKIVYSHSLPLGAVRLYDFCGEDEEKLKKVVDEKIKEYGKIPKGVNFFAVGGTATTVGAVDSALVEYDENVVHGRVITYSKILEIYQKIKNATYEERVNSLHINVKRAEIIIGGVYLLKRIMEEFEIDKITVSEGDNLLGYVKKRILGEGYEK